VRAPTVASRISQESSSIPIETLLAGSVLPGALLIYAYSERNTYADDTPYGKKLEGAAQFEAAKKVTGVWVQDMAKSESMAPFLQGYVAKYAGEWPHSLSCRCSLGVPSFVCPLVDALKVTYRISLSRSLDLTIVDKTVFGRNATQVIFSSPSL
jgi:hypothetical protein